jgi:hypothetical protein
LAGKTNASSPHEALYVFARDSIAAVRSGHWKLHARSGELYDLSVDMGELSNVAAKHPDIVQRLRGLVAGALEDMGDDSGEHPGKNARPPGRVDHPQFIINHEGKVR